MLMGASKSPDIILCYISFAVARWLTYLVSDYKVLLAVRGDNVLSDSDCISYWRARISNRVQCDSINSNNTSHVSACFKIKQKQSNEAYSNSTLPYHLYGWVLNINGATVVSVLVNGAKSFILLEALSKLITAILLLPYYSCQNLCVDGGPFLHTRGPGPKDISGS